VSTASSTTRIWKGTLSLVVLAVLAFTVRAVVFSGASYTAASPVPATVAVAGTLSHANDRDGQLVVDAAGLVPGMSSAGTMTITDSGDVTGRFSLAVSSLTDTPSAPKLSDTLTVTIADVTTTGQILYAGRVSALSNVDLGTIAAGESRSYRVTLAYPAGPNQASLQGAGMDLGLQITGVSR
jgi:hypothetical protein